MSEQQDIEYKQSWHDDYLKWVCGFANAAGGIIYIGKNNNGRVVHVLDYAKLMENIPNKIRNAMGIICDVQLLDEKGKKTHFDQSKSLFGCRFFTGQVLLSFREHKNGAYGS